MTFVHIGQIEHSQEKWKKRNQCRCSFTQFDPKTNTMNKNYRLELIDLIDEKHLVGHDRSKNQLAKRINELFNSLFFRIERIWCWRSLSSMIDFDSHLESSQWLDVTMTSEPSRFTHFIIFEMSNPRYGCSLIVSGNSWMWARRKQSHCERQTSLRILFRNAATKEYMSSTNMRFLFVFFLVRCHKWRTTREQDQVNTLEKS